MYENSALFLRSNAMTEAAQIPPLIEATATRGLTSAQAATRRIVSGPNSFGKIKDEPPWKALLESLTEPLVVLLLVVAILYSTLGELRDAAIIFGVLAGATTHSMRACISRRGGLDLTASLTASPGDSLRLRETR